MFSMQSFLPCSIISKQSAILVSKFQDITKPTQGKSDLIPLEANLISNASFYNFQ